jgi:hypothetical protein
MPNLCYLQKGKQNLSKQEDNHPLLRKVITNYDTQGLISQQYPPKPYVSADIDQADLSTKLMKFDSAKRLRQNVTQLFFALDELYLHQAIFYGLSD